jgi:hypothetical protein
MGTGTPVAGYRRGVGYHEEAQTEGTRQHVEDEAIPDAF